MSIMDTSSIEDRKAAAKTWFESLRDRITAGFEAIACPAASSARRGIVPITAAPLVAAASWR